MKDRVSLYPGRVLITPEDGSTPYHATLTRADEPTQEGTPLNKANLLTDATAALYGKTSTATPNTIFAAIKPLITAAQSAADGKLKAITTNYDGTGNTSNSLAFSAKPQFVIISSILNTLDYGEIGVLTPNGGGYVGYSESTRAVITRKISTTFASNGAIEWSMSSDGLNQASCSYCAIAII